MAGEGFDDEGEGEDGEGEGQARGGGVDAEEFEAGGDGPVEEWGFFEVADAVGVEGDPVVAAYRRGDRRLKPWATSRAPSKQQMVEVKVSYQPSLRERAGAINEAWVETVRGYDGRARCCCCCVEARSWN